MLFLGILDMSKEINAAVPTNIHLPISKKCAAEKENRIENIVCLALFITQTVRKSQVVFQAISLPLKAYYSS